MSLLEASKNCNDPDAYKKSRVYWSKINPTINGMLGGFGRINVTDLNGSRQFVHALKKFNHLTAKFYALDCGAGIGRVTKGLLLPLFERVDMIDSGQHFVDGARTYIGEKDWSRIGEYFTESLHTFQPLDQRYDCIWIQWVVGYLSDEDLVKFLQRCRNALKDGGCIVLKDNLTKSLEREYDADDSSWIRTKDELIDVINKAELIIVEDKRQLHFPKELYEVRMFALKPH